MYNKLLLTKPDLTNCIYDSDDIETLKYYLFKGFTVLQVNPDNDLQNYVSDYYNINYDNAKYFDYLTKGNYDIINLIKILIEVKNMFKVENLMFTYYDNGRYDLEFTNGWIKNIPASEHEMASVDECYWDEQGNIDKALEQGVIEMATLEERILESLSDMDEVIRYCLYDVYEETNGNLWFVESGMTYDGYDNNAKEVAQVEDGKIINLY